MIRRLRYANYFLLLACIFIYIGLHMFTMLLFSYEDVPLAHSRLEPSSAHKFVSYVFGTCIFAFAIHVFAILCLLPCHAVCGDEGSTRPVERSEAPVRITPGTERIKGSTLVFLQLLGTGVAYIRYGHFIEKTMTGNATYTYSELFYQCATEMFSAIAIIFAPYLLACKTQSDLVSRNGCGGEPVFLQSSPVINWLAGVV